ncbi:CUB domain-containing protein 2-like [Daphnia pulex]|uniref:CUB domain-containing protein 2-like n=1 Tax=Daphnia pulex TaxID=6669 RepID=UPI001EE0CE7F|nr:CUB domain-containing protein 2-like [Daphnia pulex]
MRCSIAAYVIVVALSHLVTGLNYVILTDANGYISSPNYPLEYDDYVDCRWLIQAPEFNYRIIVYFMGNFTTKTGFDRLTFYDGATTSSPVMLDWSGHEYFYPWITSKTDKMLIQFTSLRGQSEKGFKLRYYTEKKQECGGLLTFPSGTIASPGFPADPHYYDNNVDCLWEIVAPLDQKVILQFTNFTTEPGRDTVTVVDPALSNPIVMIHSGRIVPPVTVSQGNKLSVRFQSDAYMHDIPGFIAEYSMTDQ